MRKEQTEHMWLGSREQPYRCLMLALWISIDHVASVGIVELVDFILAGDDGHVASEEIDEQALAVGEHGSEQRLVFRGDMTVDHVDHGDTLVRGCRTRKEQRSVRRNRPSDYSG